MSAAAPAPAAAPPPADWAEAHGIKIRTKKGLTVPYRPKSIQMKLRTRLTAQLQAKGRVRAHILKYRQGGISTEVQYQFFRIITIAPGVEARILAQDRAGSNAVFRRTVLFKNSCTLKRPTKRNNAKEIEYEDPWLSAIRVEVAKEAKRGDTIHLLHCSEQAHWGEANADEVYLGTVNSVPDEDGSIVLNETTANGMGNLFHSEWLRAIHGESDFEPIFLSWLEEDEYRLDVPLDDPCWANMPVECLEDEERLRLLGATDPQLAWRRRTLMSRCKGSPNLFKQEYPCLVGSTRVSTDLGMIPIREAAAASRTESGNVTAWLPKGVKPVYRVRTGRGYEIVATADHRIARPDGSFVAAAESAGQTISLIEPIFAEKLARVAWHPIPGVTSFVEIDETWARFLGYFAGDGSFHGDTVSIACDAKDQDVVEDVHETLAALFGEPGRRRGGDLGGGEEVRVQRRAAREPLREFGVIQQAADSRYTRKVCVPEPIFRSPKRVVREFLSALFEADGFTGYKTPRIVLFSKYEEFLRDVQRLLLGFGITASLRVADKVAGDGHTYFGRELVLRAAEARRFHAEIGFRSARKNGRFPPPPNGKGRRPMDIVFADDVVSVEPAGEEEVYDLSIADTHVFGANGILVHNCTWQEAFISTGELAIPASIIVPRLEWAKAQEKEHPAATFTIYDRDENPIERQPRGLLRVWERPIRGDPYLLAADVARGQQINLDEESGYRDLDYSTAGVIHIPSRREVAVWHGRVDPDHFGGIICNQLGRWFNDATAVLERNGAYGPIAINALLKAGYPNVFMSRKYTKPTRQPVRVLPANFMEYGFFTGADAEKWTMVHYLYVMLRDGLLEVNEPEAFEEMLTFERLPDGSVEAKPGNHDDRVMRLAIAATILKTQPYVAPPPPREIVPYSEAWFDERDRLRSTEANRFGRGNVIA